MTTKQSGVVIGVELARKLAVKIGGKVVLMTQAVQSPDTEATDGGGGEMQSTLLRVSGIFRTGIQADRCPHHPVAVARGPSTARSARPGQSGRGPPGTGGRFADGGPGVAEQLKGIPVEVLPWREAMPTLAQPFLLDEAFNYVMNGVVLAMVGLGILNTILMRVLERRYEFGLCAALGLRPVQLAVMVIGESLALTAISLALGLVLGLGGAALFRHRRVGSALVLQEQPPPRSRF